MTHISAKCDRLCGTSPSLPPGIKTIVVYDALNGPGRNTTVRETTKGVDVVWAGESEADTFISMHISELYDQGCPQVSFHKHQQHRHDSRTRASLAL